MSLTVFQHADGGHYVIVTDFGFQIKMDDGRWEPAVLYRRVQRGPGGNWQYEGGNQFGTTKARWAERFVDTGETTARLL